jgi:hypothetical protein
MLIILVGAGQMWVLVRCGCWSDVGAGQMWELINVEISAWGKYSTENICWERHVPYPLKENSTPKLYSSICFIIPFLI